MGSGSEDLSTYPAKCVEHLPFLIISMWRPRISMYQDRVTALATRLAVKSAKKIEE